jgi:hypothetical protein
VQLRQAERGEALSFDGSTLTTFFGPRWRLMLIGAGQLSQAVAQMAQMLDFEILVCEPRQEYTAGWSLPDVTMLSGMPDDEVLANPSAFFDQVIEIDLSKLKPLINGPHSPDRAHPIGADGVGKAARENDWPLEVSAALIGSCTNSSYEDITRAASIARQAAAKGLKAKTELLISPGSEQIRATIERDGLLADLEAIGATVLAIFRRSPAFTGAPPRHVSSASVCACGSTVDDVSSPTAEHDATASDAATTRLGTHAPREKGNRNLNS